MSDEQPVKISSLQDLADLAGVSRATASRALNNSPLLNKKTREKLQQLAKEHGYAINQRARDFRLSKTRVISVVFMLDVQSKQHMSDPFFLGMLGGIADRLAERDYDLLLFHSSSLDLAEFKNSRAIAESDGVIFIGQGVQHDQLEQLARSDSRFVVWGHPVANRNYVVVGSENVSGGYQATRHLLEHGRRQIAFLGKTDNPEIRKRYVGYQNALTDFGLSPVPDLKFAVPFDMKGAHRAILKIIADKPNLDAFFCSSDIMALATMSVLQETGKQVPRDIAVVGYDDINLAEYSSPPLTTVRQNISAASIALADSILALVNDKQVEDTVLPAELIIRKSCGAHLGTS